MIGLVIVTHCNLGRALIATAETMLGTLESVWTVSVVAQISPEKLHEKIAAAIGDAQSGHGVLVLTDMFGGTPSNISLSFLDENKVEVVSGVNLPMLIKAVESRESMDLSALAQAAAGHARASITVMGRAGKSRGEGAGVVVAAQGGLAREFISTTEFILGRLDHVWTVDVGETANDEELNEIIEEAIITAEEGRGVLLLTDMSEGACARIPQLLLEENELQAVSGVNLPMLIKTAQARQRMDLAALAQAASSGARASINIAGQILKGRQEQEAG